MNVATEQQTNGKAHHASPVAAQSILLASIDESPSNPRKTFADVDELAADIKLHGVLQDVLCRPHPKKPGRFELVFGARRFRAAKLAGLKDIPAKVRELDDAKVLELQIVENSQRADIHPLEEGDGYQQLHVKHGWSVEDISAKVGKSVGTVRARLKLCSLSPAAREAVFANKLTMGAALVVARIPHADVQTKAIAELTEHFRDEDGPLSERDVAWSVRTKYMLRLVDAPFDRSDARLVAGAPGCATCPKRTGNQRELFGDFDGEQDDLCTDTKCFDAKKSAAWAKRVAEAEAKAQTILPEKDTKKVFSHGSSLATDAKYVDLGAKNYEDPKARTNKELLGKADVPIVLARDLNGGIHELVAKADFQKVAKVRAPERSSYGEEQKKARDLEAKRRAALAASVAELVAKVEKREPSDAFWRALARASVRGTLADTRKDVCTRRGIGVGSFSEEPLKALLAAVATMSGAEARGLCVEIGVTVFRGDTKESLKEMQALFAPRAAKKAKPAAKKKGKAKR